LIILRYFHFFIFRFRFSFSLSFRLALIFDDFRWRHFHFAIAAADAAWFHFHAIIFHWYFIFIFDFFRHIVLLAVSSAISPAVDFFHWFDFRLLSIISCDFRIMPYFAIIFLHLHSFFASSFSPPGFSLFHFSSSLPFFDFFAFPFSPCFRRFAYYSFCIFIPFLLFIRFRLFFSLPYYYDLPFFASYFISCSFRHLPAITISASAASPHYSFHFLLFTFSLFFSFWSWAFILQLIIDISFIHYITYFRQAFGHMPLLLIFAAIFIEPPLIHFRRISLPFISWLLYFIFSSHFAMFLTLFSFRCHFGFSCYFFDYWYCSFSSFLLRFLLLSRHSLFLYCITPFHYYVSLPSFFAFCIIYTQASRVPGCIFFSQHSILHSIILHFSFQSLSHEYLYIDSH